MINQLPEMMDAIDISDDDSYTPSSSSSSSDSSGYESISDVAHNVIPSKEISYLIDSTFTVTKRIKKMQANLELASFHNQPLDAQEFKSILERLRHSRDNGTALLTKVLSSLHLTVLDRLSWILQH
jgi:hypothetical protein